MSTFVHFLDVGQGNMVLIQAASGQNFLFDCNVTEANESEVFGYLSKRLARKSPIEAFICSHRDADHIRGIEKIHAKYPIRAIWDSGYPGTTTDSSKYYRYMNLYRQFNAKVVKKKTSEKYGETYFNFLSARDERLTKNANSQGIVMKVEHRLSSIVCLGSVMLTGDSDAKTWSDAIMQDFSASELKSDILMVGHHGSKSFIELSTGALGPNNYTNHLKAVDPDVCVISVGNKSHGHPDSMAIDCYEEYSNGAFSGEKIVRTDHHGSIMVEIGRVSALMTGWEINTFGFGALHRPLNLHKNMRPYIHHHNTRRNLRSAVQYPPVVTEK